MSGANIILAYISPETVLPLTSVVAAIAGGSMFLTRRSIQVVVRCFRGVLRRSQRTTDLSKPLFRSPDGVGKS